MTLPSTSVRSDQGKASRARAKARSAALIESFGGAEVIAFAAQFTFRRRRAGTLLAWAWLSLCHLLALARETRFPDIDARATGALSATLAAIGFAFVGVALSGPLIFDHSATGAGGRGS